MSRARIHHDDVEALDDRALERRYRELANSPTSALAPPPDRCPHTSKPQRRSECSQCLATTPSTVRRLVHLGDTGSVVERDVPPPVDELAARRERRGGGRVARTTDAEFRAAFKRHGGNLTAIATELGYLRESVRQRAVTLKLRTYTPKENS